MTVTRHTRGPRRNAGPARVPGPASVDAWFAALPAERAAQLARVRDVLVRHMPPGYEEVMQKNAVVYQVPIDRYPDSPGGQPLWYAALAAPKSYLTLHLMGVYGSAELRRRLEAGFEREGKRLDMGKGCVRFQRADDLALDAIGTVVAALPVARWVEIARTARARSARRG